MAKTSRIISVLLCCGIVLVTGCSLFDRVPAKKEFTGKLEKALHNAKRILPE